MTRKERIKLRKLFFGTLCIAVMALAMVMGNFYTNIQENPEIDNPLQWLKAPGVWATEQNPGVGTAGIVQIVTVADAFASWNAAIAANIYEESDGAFIDASVDAPHEELSETTPYETDFHVGVTYQFTKAMAYDGGAWNASRVYAIINTTGYTNDASSVNMSKGSWFAGEDANTQRINFYILDDDGGADDANPLQIAIDSTWNANVTIFYYG